MGENTILVAKKLTKRFGGLTAVDRIDLNIFEGKRHAIIGPNGSGKTTLINIFTGFYIPEEGTVEFNGIDITRMTAYDRAKIGIARTFQNIRLHADMSVKENIALGMHCRSSYNFMEAILHAGRYKKEEANINEKIEQISEQLNIADLLNQNVSKIPYGQCRIIEIARALAMQPKLLLLDEPAAGMNNMETIMLAEIIRNITKMNVTILLIEHNMDFIRDIADNVMVMETGAKIAEGLFSEISKAPIVIEAYLGKGTVKHAANF
jgi:branched-chain amino acid transport system ATP-binding protein